MSIGTGEDRAELREDPSRGSIPEDTFAVRVMLARVHAGYQTIDEAARKCGLNRQSWSNWEKGMKPRDLLEVVDAISEGLGIDRNWLLFGGPLAKPPTQRDRHGRRGGGSLTRRYVISPVGGTPFGLATLATPRAQRPSDNRPPGHMSHNLRRSIEDIGRAA